MTLEVSRQSRERLAWAILFVGFAACLFFGITLPLAVNAYLQNATATLDATVQANQGTVGIDNEGGQRRAALAGEPPQDVGPNATILTDTTASALFTLAAPDNPSPLTTLQISSNTSLHVDRATAPRFSLSRQPHRINLNLQNGRVRLDVPPADGREVVMNLTTPQGNVSIREPGRYMVEVSNDATQVTVQERGLAALSTADESLELAAGQRAEIPISGPPIGPLDPARNLVQNGDFSQGLDNWSVFAWQVERSDQPKGTTEVSNEGSDPAVHFTRTGIGHADVRISQSINQDVSGYDTLRLLLTLKVNNQSLGVCGVQGSECPAFVIVNYVDESGVSRVWQHGFYSQGTVDDNLTPGACISCAVVQRPHERIPTGQLYFYETDLKAELASQGFLPPRTIESVTVVASGHTFDTEVSDVALIVE